MAFTSPYQKPGRWFKGNLHTHSTQSDGELTPDQVIAWYDDHGYDLIAVSDHWVLSKGQTIRPDLITLTAAELHGAGYHLLTLGLTELPPREWADDPQRIIDALKAQGALCYIAHPYWTGQSSAEVMALQNLDGLEAFNAVCEESKGNGHSRVHWDDCLAAGRQLTGLAVDDSHWHRPWQGIGYVMVRAPQLTEEAILSALAQGDFYSSTGPVIEDLGVLQNAHGEWEAYVRCSPCREIIFYTAAQRGRRIAAADGELISTARLALHPQMRYVRVECRAADGGVAWANPIYLAETS
ncbi:MAG: CehA/McbA family metallohydrolase [Anaerolineae bacterium]|nr:CehA/McbA family metallohydrolase [Chloroflexota bacterium]